MNDREHATHAADSISRSMPDEVEVAVVGAGPVGLTIATMLAAYGIRTVVLDRAAGPAAHSRAAVVQARTLETLEPLGIVEEALRRGVIVSQFSVRDRDQRLLAVDFGRLPTAHPYTLMLPQDETESLLREALGRRGGAVLWGHEVTGISQNHNEVEIKVRYAQRNERLRARFVIGCDGAHSTVREVLGMRFEGATYPQSFVLADVLMDWGLPDDEVQLFFSPEGLVVVAPLPHGLHRVVATVDDAPPEPSLKDVQALLDARGPRAPRPVVDKVVWSSRFRVHYRVAAAFREGAVFLCGDAAHIHSPAGGQGMNTGIQDAMNLAWKLALVIRGYAPGSLLDSYERERKQVAREVVATTHRITRSATMRSRVSRRIRNVLLSGADRTGWLAARLARNLAEIDITYRSGWSVDGSTAVERWAPKGDAALPGADPAFRLVVPSAHADDATAVATGLPGLPVRVSPKPGIKEAAIVRPDGYVAGRGAPGEEARLLDLLARALEAPAERRGS
jgi:2-polyprenyl-6-methoxyphenol hydroxylase-like FAD-dependent oxidoreductase